MTERHTRQGLTRAVTEVRGFDEFDEFEELDPPAPHLPVIAAGGCWCGLSLGHPWPGKADGAPHPRDASRGSAEKAQAAQVWPCDDYAAPLTCFTTPKARTSACDGCRAAFPRGEEVRALYRVVAYRWTRSDGEFVWIDPTEVSVVTKAAQERQAHAARVFAGDRECGDWTCWCPGRPHVVNLPGGHRHTKRCDPVTGVCDTSADTHIPPEPSSDCDCVRCAPDGSCDCQSCKFGGRS